MKDKYEPLKLKNQLCFPLYVVSKEIIKKYKPLLSKLELTYTQYIAMLAIWEEECLTSKKLGEYLYLDSGTLTPLLKKLEQKGYITRKRSDSDERNLIISVTKKGEALKEKALIIPEKMAACSNLDSSDAKILYSLLYKFIRNM